MKMLTQTALAGVIDTIRAEAVTGLEEEDLNTLHLMAARCFSPLPVDMILHCPKCGTQHVDKPYVMNSESDPTAPELNKEWTNPPHKTHLCLNPRCKNLWRPADVPTNGVLELKEAGKDYQNPGPHMAVPALPRQQVDKEHRICEHGRDAWADDCGMCDGAGTNWAMP